jgi:hypothetical protein
MNTNICSHCENSECNVTNYQEPVNNDRGICININELVKKLPHELLVKIYNEYFRPVKFYQLFKYITANTRYTQNFLYLENKQAFIRHVHIFLFGDIRKYIKKRDIIFDEVLYRMQQRGYTSAFSLISEYKKSLKSSLFLELLMHKYH